MDLSCELDQQIAKHLLSDMGLTKYNQQQMQTNKCLRK